MKWFNFTPNFKAFLAGAILTLVFVLAFDGFVGVIIDAHAERMLQPQHIADDALPDIRHCYADDAPPLWECITFRNMHREDI